MMSIEVVEGRFEEVLERRLIWMINPEMWDYTDLLCSMNALRGE
jgi:hypothetical protein